jgi:hypothetical protein
VREIQPLCLHLGENPRERVVFVLGQAGQIVDFLVMSPTKTHSIAILFSTNALIG